MLNNLDYALLGIVAEKKQGILCSKQFIRCLSFVGTIDKISSIYQFVPENTVINHKNMYTHICFSLLLQVKEQEDWGTDFGLQIKAFAEQSAKMTQSHGFEVYILDFRSQFSMCKSVTIPYPKWIDKAELLFPSLEIIPQAYVHPVLQEPLAAELLPKKIWENSDFLQTGRSLLTI